MQAAVPIIILGSSLYVINKMYLLRMRAVIGTAIISDAEIRGILNFSITAMLALLVITGILLAYLGIMFSHQVAGPLHKLGKNMDRLAKGETVEPMSFRKTDITNGLAEKFNAIAKRLNQLKQ
jgi:signal transduction histidine kinase